MGCGCEDQASIMASATASTAVPGTSTSALEERGVGGLRRHTLFLARDPMAALATRVALAAQPPLALTFGTLPY